MLASLAIVALGLAVANDEGDGDASIEERFRMLYTLGDKPAAYRLLFADKGHIADARRDVLKPLLFRLTEQMQGTKTLEDLKTVLEEIEAIRVGWSTWRPSKLYGTGFNLLDIVNRRDRTLAPGRKEVMAMTGECRSPGYQVLAWGKDSATPSATADTPIFVDLKIFKATHPGLYERNGWTLRTQGRLLGWDSQGRALSMYRVTDAEDRSMEDFRIQSLESYLDMPF